MTADKKKSTSTTPAEQRMLYVSLGVVFLGLGVTLSVTLQNMAMGLPFFVLGIVYFVMGINAMKTKPAEKPEEQGGAPSTGSGTDRSAPSTSSGTGS